MGTSDDTKTTQRRRNDYARTRGVVVGAVGARVVHVHLSEVVPLLLLLLVLFLGGGSAGPCCRRCRRRRRCRCSHPPARRESEEGGAPNGWSVRWLVGWGLGLTHSHDARHHLLCTTLAESSVNLQVAVGSRSLSRSSASISIQSSRVMWLDGRSIELRSRQCQDTPHYRLALDRLGRGSNC